MKLLDRLFRRRGRHAGPRLLTGRHARRAQARIAETTGALPTVVERDQTARVDHVRRHWRIEDADTGVIDRALVDDHELVRGHVRALHRMQGGW